MASFGDVLRPLSTGQLAREANSLLHNGFFPVGDIPATVYNRFVLREGPALAGNGRLPKIAHGTVDVENAPARMSGAPPKTTWCPVFYVVLWRLGQRRADTGAYSPRAYLLDIARFQTTQGQSALLLSYVLSGIKYDVDKDVLRIAIDAAIKQAKGGSSD